MSLSNRIIYCLFFLTLPMISWSRTESLCASFPDAVTTAENFRVVIWGDSQVAHYEPGNKDYGNAYFEAISEQVNPRLSQVVDLTNSLDPAFVITLGDNVHGIGEWEHYQVFLDRVKPLRAPLYMLMGNHDQAGKVDLREENPYPGKEFGNFFRAQELTGGIAKACYSFNAGQWHFVLFSQPGGSGVGVTRCLRDHPEFLSWLKTDLEKNKDRPTLFFTHHPLLPAGRHQIDKYGPSAEQRGQLMDALCRWGNVKYAFFGHVHNTVSSIPLTSWRYNSTAFILLPNTAFFTRDYFYQETAASSWGVGIISIDGERCNALKFHTLAGEIIEIKPGELPVYHENIYGYLTPDANLPAKDHIRNGSFEQPLETGWYRNHLMPYQTPPIQKRYYETHSATDEGTYLYLYTRATDSKVSFKANYLISEVRQAIAVPQKNIWPQLKLRYLIRPEDYHQPNLCRAYILVSGYGKQEAKPLFTLAYSLGSPLYRYGRSRPYFPIERTPVLGEWKELILNIRSDLQTVSPDTDWGELGVDTVVVSLGVHNENYCTDGEVPEIGIGFDDVKWSNVLNWPPQEKVSTSQE